MSMPVPSNKTNCNMHCRCPAIVMSEASKDLADSAKTIKFGPNYFGYYTSEVADLILQEDDFLPFFDQKAEENRDDYTNKHDGKGAINLSNPSSMFSNCMGAALSDFRQERLKALLHQSVTAFKQEVDEDSGCGDMSSKIPKGCSSENQLPTVPNGCAHCESPEGPMSSCNTCGTRFKQGSEPPAKLQDAESPLNTSHHAEKEVGEVDEDLQVLLETNGPQVEAAVKKFSDELSTNVSVFLSVVILPIASGHMEHQLDKLIKIVLSKCRPMTPTEKQQLRFLIQKLPPRNLDRVVEIIQHSNPPETDCCDEIHVDLENQDNHTLWRLYYCQKALKMLKMPSIS
ncbi:NET domain [Dillenia turbinata]|uniref:NET domain n=1 Tax=Dillenia turbinata TaxID=194707 RepID=A0AAN8Z6K9_9MAGN